MNNKKVDWYNKEAPRKSYRSVFKWGDPATYKNPKPSLVSLMKELFHLDDDYFEKKEFLGEEKVSDVPPLKLDAEHIEAFQKIVGKKNVYSDDYTRVKFAYGKTMLDSLRLRHKILENIPDLVISPRNKNDVVELVKFCNEKKIPVIPFGAGSTVTRATEATKGGIILDMSANMNKIIELNEINHTCTVQAGMLGPDYEKALNSAKEIYSTKHSFTCGHFPQSFEYSTVGGWIAAKGAGQQSTHYGKIEDLVIATEWVTPAGVIKTKDFPYAALGPDIDAMFIGSEGCFGVLVEATLKIFKYFPNDRQYFSFMFKNYESALEATREIMQGEYYTPSVFRLSDPEETMVAMHLYGVSETPLSPLLEVLGYKDGERAVLIGFTDGRLDQGLLTSALIHKTCLMHGALPAGGFITKNWMKGRYKDPYLREDLQDYGIIIDTLETAVTWESLPKVRKAIIKYVKSRPDTVCMMHTSHFYAQGGNLYVIFIAKMNDIEVYKKFQAGILETFDKSGGTLSHHHGIGKMTAPWFEKHIGKNQMDIFRALKKHFDPNNIMNPGGTLALDKE